MPWHAWGSEVARVVVRLSAGAALGALPAALYAGLVSVVHFAVTARWERLPAFALGCLAVGALVGLLGAAWSLSGRRPARPPAGTGRLAVRFPAPADGKSITSAPRGWG
jgi:hypothetical protein